MFASALRWLVEVMHKTLVKGPSWVNSKNQGQDRALQASLPEGVVQPYTRYLGCRYNYTLTCHTEVQYRVRAIRANWVQMGNFWKAQAPYRVKRLVFIGRIVGAAAAGCEAYPYSCSEENSFRRHSANLCGFFLRVVHTVPATASHGRTWQFSNTGVSHH